MDILSGISSIVAIQKTNDFSKLEWCAQLMSNNEPWITLERPYLSSIHLLQDPLSQVYLMTEGNTPLGFVMIKLQGPFTGYIQTIVIIEQARGRGIGEAAIHYVEELIYKVSPNVFICVSTFNKRAEQLYLRMGFEKIGVLKNYVKEGYDELFMRKTKGPLNDFNK